MAAPKRRKVTLDDYFTKGDALPSAHSTTGEKATAAEETVPSCSSAQPEYDSCAERTSESLSEHDACKETTIPDNDIGLYVVNGPRRQDLQDDETRRRLLMTPWKPGANYSFPSVSKRKLKFQPHWQEMFSWLVYSKYQEGALCKTCVLFGKESSGKGTHQVLGALVLSPFTRWKNALENFRSHNECDYHKAAALYATNFLEALKGESVAEKMESSAQAQRELNRKKLISIIDTVIFCGRQGIPLRGHRDAGPLSLEEPAENDGNFRALLRFKVRSGDTALRKHLESAASNATYLSPQIQNEILAAAGNFVQDEIVRKVNSAKCFALLADETTDISGDDCIHDVAKNSCTG